MKRVIIVFLALIFVVPMFSQEGDNSVNDASLRSKDLQEGLKILVEVGGGTRGLIFKHDNGEAISLNLNFILGFQVNPNISAGMGTGWHYFEGSWGWPSVDHLIPIFIDFTINILERRVSPYIEFRGGYSFYLDYNNSFFVNPVLGLAIKLSDKFALNVGYDAEIQFDKYSTFGLNLGLSYKF